MPTRIALTSILCAVLSATACQQGPDRASEPRLDFEALLTSVDDAIGKRFQTMQMDGLQSATYHYDGPIESVLDVVGPFAERAGFSESEETGEFGSMGPAEREMQQRMGFEIKVAEHKLFRHPRGDTLMVSRMHMSGDELDMKVLTIHLINQQETLDSLDER